MHRLTLRPALAPALAALLVAPAAAAQEPPPGLPLWEDPALARLVEESLAARPELAAAAAEVRAGAEQVPQASALPDPVLSLGIQNDGFDRIMVGEMETSFYSVGLAQTLPWPGKRGLRADVARAGVREAEALLSRARLGAEADVARAYLDLVLVRDRLELLGRLETIWSKSEGVARARYESGEGAQTDLLRAQLERTRLRQRRIGLEAEERARLAALNRLRGKAPGERVETVGSLARLADPAPPDLERMLADAEARSPELAQARAAAQGASTALDLARRERYPDFTVSAGLMPRGSLDPMWQAGVSVTLPVFSGRKQGRAVAEQAARAEVGRSALAAQEEVLRLRVVERHEALGAALDTLGLYRRGLLVQSRATAESALAQYQVGRVPFTAVLEAVAGNVGDEEGFLGAAADAQRLQVAVREVSLEPTLPGVAAAGGARMASGAAPARGSARGAPGAAAGGGEQGGGAAPAMGGM